MQYVMLFMSEFNKRNKVVKLILKYKFCTSRLLFGMMYILSVIYKFPIFPFCFVGREEGRGNLVK